MPFSSDVLVSIKEEMRLNLHWKPGLHTALLIWFPSPPLFLTLSVSCPFRTIFLCSHLLLGPPLPQPAVRADRFPVWLRFSSTWSSSLLYLPSCLLLILYLPDCLLLFGFCSRVYSFSSASSSSIVCLHYALGFGYEIGHSLSSHFVVQLATLHLNLIS